MIDKLKLAASAAEIAEQDLEDEVDGSCMITLTMLVTGIEIRGVVWPAGSPDRVGAARVVSWTDLRDAKFDILIYEMEAVVNGIRHELKEASE